MSQRALNFGAGPAALPLKVLEQVHAEWFDFAGTGKSILETSHRSPEYDAVHEDAKTRMKRLLGLDDQFEVLFMQGGATTQFSMVAQNLLGPGKHADYFVTGSWAKKAFKEAQAYGDARVAASSEDQNFGYIPKPESWQLSEKATYVHITTNNTIYGTQWHTYPEVPGHLTADMSSDILWRAADFSKFSLIYAGAQKNLGPSGVTTIIVRKGYARRLQHRTLEYG